MKPPMLDWNGNQAGIYFVRSKQTKGSPRQFCAVLASPCWEGPARRSAIAARIDAEYHSAGRLDERPPCFAYEP